jgi:DNA modification methylase
VGAILDQQIEEKWAIYNGDAMEVLPDLPTDSIHMSIYSPPFGVESGGALYHYSSSDRDLSNSRTYKEFEEQYSYIIREIHRLTMPGRISAVHCADIPTGNTGTDALADFPGDIIRWHRALGFDYIARYNVWKEPFKVRMRTMRKSLAHKSIVDDSSRCSNAGADFLLTFRKRGDNPVPITHPVGLTEYAGFREPPPERLRFRGMEGNQIQNLFSHWVWRQYASAFWDDVRLDRVLPFKEGKDEDDEKHVHPLQLDVIQRALTLWSNPGERILTPCAGVGSEVYESVRLDRYGIGIELKPSYYRQMVKNLASIGHEEIEQSGLFDGLDDEPEWLAAEAVDLDEAVTS